MSARLWKMVPSCFAGVCEVGCLEGIWRRWQNFETDAALETTICELCTFVHVPESERKEKDRPFANFAISGQWLPRDCRRALAASPRARRVPNPALAAKQPRIKAED